MSNLSWWRSWHGAPMDPKWQVIAVRSGVKVGIVSAVAWALLDYASQQADRGSIKGFDVETYAVYSGFEEIEVAAVLHAMNDKGIISNDRLANWEKRQPKSETEIQRVTEYREKKKKVTESYDLLQDVTENYTDKIKDTDTDTEEKEIKEINNDFLARFQQIARVPISDVTVLTELEQLEKDYPAIFWRALDWAAKTSPPPSNAQKYLRMLGTACTNWREPEKSNGNGRAPDPHAGKKKYTNASTGEVEWI